MTKKASSNTDLPSQDKTSEGSPSSENHEHDDGRMNSLGFIDVANFFDSQYDGQEIQFPTEPVSVPAENDIDFAFLDTFFVEEKQSSTLLDNVGSSLTDFETISSLSDKMAGDIQESSEKSPECEKPALQVQKGKLVIPSFAEAMKLQI